MRRLTAVGMLAAVLCGLGARSAWADYVRPLPDPQRPGVAVGATTVTGQADDRGGGRCRFHRLDGILSARSLAWWQQQNPGQRGGVYSYNCGTPERPTSSQVAWVPDSPPPDPEVLAREAARRLTPPAPRLGVNPPADPANPPVVHLPVWLWVAPASWQPVQATASVPGASATVVAEPVRVTWAMGDGRQVVCDGPGEPFTAESAGRAPACGHTYQRSGRYQVTATVTYQVSWSADGVAGSGVLPAVSSSAQLALPVGEIETFNES